MINLQKLSEIINREFSEPFLPKGHVFAELREDGTMDLFIGRRDVNIDANGKVLGAGTGLCHEVPEDKSGGLKVG